MDALGHGRPKRAAAGSEVGQSAGGAEHRDAGMGTTREGDATLLLRLGEQVQSARGDDVSIKAGEVHGMNLLVRGLGGAVSPARHHDRRRVLQGCDSPVTIR